MTRFSNREKRASSTWIDGGAVARCMRLSRARNLITAPVMPGGGTTGKPNRSRRDGTFIAPVSFSRAGEIGRQGLGAASNTSKPKLCTSGEFA
jgi:hypothetical protein